MVGFSDSVSQAFSLQGPGSSRVAAAQQRTLQSVGQALVSALWCSRWLCISESTQVI